MNAAPAAMNPRTLDEIDSKIVEILQRDARIPNARLADQVGIAQSTCIARVKSLIERGVISGFHAHVSPRAMGFALEALISVGIKAGARSAVGTFAEEMRALPEVVQVFFLGGAEDFIVHVATRDSDHVRQFVVDNLSAHPSVSFTRTSLVFDHHAPGLTGSGVRRS